MTFWEHLGELRTRLIRVFLYIVVAATLGWYTFPVVNTVLIEPGRHLFAIHHIPWIYTSFYGPFYLRFQVAIIMAVAYALPFILGEIWGFTGPALMPHERKWVYFVTPLAVLFFLLGAASGYLVMQPAISWFLGYVPTGQVVLQSAPDFIVFECKCILAFGLVFELPVVLMFLAMVRVINSEMLKKQWRYAVCLLVVIASIVTPSNDPGTMAAMSLPLLVLYVVSIFLVQITEKMCGRGPKAAHTEDPLQSG